LEGTRSRVECMHGHAETRDESQVKRDFL
jgi:hypothetical protein